MSIDPAVDRSFMREYKDRLIFCDHVGVPAAGLRIYRIDLAKQESRRIHVMDQSLVDQ